MSTIDVSDLPKWEFGANKGEVKWGASVGRKISFTYGDLSGELFVKSFIKHGQKLIVSYCGNDHKTYVASLYQCNFGRILGLRTIDFKIKIGEDFVDKKRNITITNRFYKNHKNKKKFYTYKCNVCGATELEIDEYNLLNGRGCSCCYGRTVVEGINDVPTTAPWMVEFFQGGYDEAKLYTCGSNEKIYPICPDCGKVKSKTMMVSTIHTKRTICCTCSDGISYPEKFMISLLSQIKNEYVYQLTKTVCGWCNDYMYDFYIGEKSCIVEVHGAGHYLISGFSSMGGKTLEEEKENDYFKEVLAKGNGIKNYITIDARKSELEWIKNSIMSSELPCLFDFTENDINWDKCEEYALSNKVKEVCDYWNKGIKNPKTIGMIVKLHPSTINRYLKKGKNVGWCDYSKDKVVFSRNVVNRKKVAIYKDGICLNIFESISQLSENSIKLFGVKLHVSEISNCCNKKIKQYKKYEFKFI